MKSKHVLIGAAAAWMTIASSCGAGAILKSNSIGQQWLTHAIHVQMSGRPPVSEAMTWAMMGFGLCLMAVGYWLMQPESQASRLPMLAAA